MVPVGIVRIIRIRANRHPLRAPVFCLQHISPRRDAAQIPQREKKILQAVAAHFTSVKFNRSYLCPR
jgi:hypothetical protein